MHPIAPAAREVATHPGAMPAAKLGEVAAGSYPAAALVACNPLVMLFVYVPTSRETAR